MQMTPNFRHISRKGHTLFGFSFVQHRFPHRYSSNQWITETGTIHSATSHPEGRTVPRRILRRVYYPSDVSIVCRPQGNVFARTRRSRRQRQQPARVTLTRCTHTDAHTNSNSNLHTYTPTHRNARWISFGKWLNLKRHSLRQPHGEKHPRVGIRPTNPKHQLLLGKMVPLIFFGNPYRNVSCFFGGENSKNQHKNTRGKLGSFSPRRPAHSSVDFSDSGTDSIGRRVCSVAADTDGVIPTWEHRRRRRRQRLTGQKTFPTASSGEKLSAHGKQHGLNRSLQRSITQSYYF